MDDKLSMDNYRKIEQERLMRNAMFGYRYGTSASKIAGFGKTIESSRHLAGVGIEPYDMTPQYHKQAYNSAAMMQAMEEAMERLHKQMVESFGSIRVERFQDCFTVFVNSEGMRKATEVMAKAAKELVSRIPYPVMMQAEMPILDTVALQAWLDSLKPTAVVSKPSPKKMPYYHGRRRY